MPRLISLLHGWERDQASRLKKFSGLNSSELLMKLQVLPNPSIFDALVVCRAHRGFKVGFLLLRYSVLFTVESLSLLYLLVIY